MIMNDFPHPKTCRKRDQDSQPNVWALPYSSFLSHLFTKSRQWSSMLCSVYIAPQLSLVDDCFDTCATATSMASALMAAAARGH